METNKPYRIDFWLTLVIGSLLVLLVITLGFSFFMAIFNAQLNSRKEFLNKQTELASRGIELEIRRFEEESKELINYLEDPNHELDDYDEEFTYAVRRLFNSFPQLVDTVWVDMMDSVLVFNKNDRTEFFRTQSDKGFPSTDEKRFSNLILGKKGFRVLYSLDLVSYAKEFVMNYYLNPGGGKFLIYNDRLIPLNSNSIQIQASKIADLENDLALGLKGFYEASWQRNDEETSGIIAQYPFSFVLSSESGAMVFAVPAESLTSGIYQTYFFLFLGFVALLIFTVGFFVVSIKNNLEFQRTQEANIQEISELFDQQNLLLQELKGFVYFHDAKGQITRISDEVRDILGMEPHEFRSAFKAESNNVEVQNLRAIIFQALDEKRDLVDFEYDFIMPDGKRIRLKVFEKLIFDASGQFNGGMGICTDITDTYQSRIKLIESENRLRTLIGNIPDNIFLYDNDSRVIDFHVQDKEELEEPSRQTLGKSLQEFVPHGQTGVVLEAFYKAREKRSIQTINVKWEGPKGEKHFEMRFFPLDAEKMMSISKDITTQKIWEKGLVDAMNAADQASKAKSDFLANMSHEIRTPMNGLLGIIDLLEQTKLNAIQQQYVDIIKNSGNMLLGIIKDILDYSKIEAGKVEIFNEVFDPMQELENQAQILSGLANKKDIAFNFESASKQDFLAQGDKVKINQIFLNLVGNAIKFTPEKGKVDVSVGLEQISGDAYYINCKIIDTGIGISDEHLEKLSEPFYQIDSSATRNYQGTGLGLAIAKKLIELLGGDLVISSEKGIGSVFEFSVLVKKVEKDSLKIDKKELSWAEVKEMGETHPLKILLTEDNDLNLQLMKLMLNQLGFQYEVARNGEEAVEKVKEQDFDIVLMDVQMPIMNGLEATDEIRKLPKKRDLVIIGLSANVFDEDQMKAIESGMDDYLTKPIRLAVLAERLEHYYKKIIEKRKK
ncbi:PAS domain-containing hybrid sensor histidine kinase/response regulator [Algoriphagus algorifonticola]|jgi:PAS domain S-box-containing protein|uniref:PAS domain-containing hybrid sensor histidine kinase/response regulator n=1 Tax=Algoriphagus algorifonticola TaxID=2593007 RepID=UPI0011A3F3A1|nr:PAS domain-containing hybrid sensor histidine kinase/response regulator [Algoriphagus algorifonticola]